MKKLESLQKKKELIEQQIRRARARERANRRKQELERKILVGTFFLKISPLNQIAESMIREGFLSEKRDHEIMGIPFHPSSPSDDAL